MCIRDSARPERPKHSVALDTRGLQAYGMTSNSAKQLGCQSAKSNAAFVVCRRACASPGAHPFGQHRGALAPDIQPQHFERLFGGLPKQVHRCHDRVESHG
eukprot:5500347-Alexandrium_andersonii.AAC.1